MVAIKAPREDPHMAPPHGAPPPSPPAAVDGVMLDPSQMNAILAALGSLHADITALRTDLMSLLTDVKPKLEQLALEVATQHVRYEGLSARAISLEDNSRALATVQADLVRRMSALEAENTELKVRLGALERR